MVGAACWWVLFPISVFFCCKRLISMPVRVKACIVLGAVLYWLLSTIGCCFRVSVFFKRLISMPVRVKASIVLAAVYYWLLSTIVCCCLLLVPVYCWLLFPGKCFFLNA